MGYARSSRYKLSASPNSRDDDCATAAALAFGVKMGGIGHGEKLIVVSGFLQAIVRSLAIPVVEPASAAGPAFVSALHAAPAPPTVIGADNLLYQSLGVLVDGRVKRGMTPGTELGPNKPTGVAIRAQLSSHGFNHRAPGRSQVPSGAWLRSSLAATP
jgi:hypothetical protein